jgi:hypothetical protein
MPNLFYFTAMRQARSPMTDFLIDFCIGRKNFVSTLRYAKNLRAMPHSAEFQLFAMPLSAELFKTVSKSATPRYAIKCEIQVKYFLVDSPRYAAQFDEKTGDRKSRETVPLIKFNTNAGFLRGVIILVLREGVYLYTMTPSRIANKLRGECSYHTPIRVVLSTKKLGIKLYNKRRDP